MFPCKRLGQILNYSPVESVVVDVMDAEANRILYTENVSTTQNRVGSDLVQIDLRPHLNGFVRVPAFAIPVARDIGLDI